MKEKNRPNVEANIELQCNVLLLYIIPSVVSVTPVASSGCFDSF
jgi:hypothetical protein